jgi:hypothetical protein
MARVRWAMLASHAQVSVVVERTEPQCGIYYFQQLPLQPAAGCTRQTEHRGLGEGDC